MYEGAAEEISEADFNAALKYAQEAIQPLIAAQKELVARVGKQKREITLKIVPDEILAEATDLFLCGALLRVLCSRYVPRLA